MSFDTSNSKSDQEKDLESSDAYESEEGGVRLETDSLPPTIDLGTAEGTPRSSNESPTANYHRIFQALPDSALILDLKGVIQDVNQQFLYASGYSREDLIGQSLDEFIVAQDLKQGSSQAHREVERYIVESIEHRSEGKDCVIRYRNKKNETIPIEFAGAAIHDDGDNVVGIVSLGRDMSEIRTLRESLKASELLIEDYNRSLETQMGERLKEVKQRARILEELSVTDELTKLYNRRYLFRRAAEELHRSSRYNTPFSVAILDIDFFKKVNDTYGHLAGDMVLYELSGILRGSIRQVDVVARTGGEEFVILLPSVREGHAYIFCERLRNKVKEFKFTYLPDDERVTVSMGVTDYPREEITDIDDLINLADQALYKAKETRDCTVSSANLDPKRRT